MSEIEATLNRIGSYKGVRAVIIVGKDGQILRSNAPMDVRDIYAKEVPSIAQMAREMIRDLDPQNDLKFLRFRSRTHEIMVSAYPEFTLIVVQDVTIEE